MTEDQIEAPPQQKIYTPLSIQLSTFLAGPLVAGFLMAENFKLLGEPEKVKLTWIHTALATVIIYTAMFVIPEIKYLPSYVIPIISSGVVAYLVRRYQGEKIRAHVEKGGKFYPFWRVIIVCIIGAVITTAVSFTVLYFTDRELFDKLVHLLLNRRV